ncbi:MAG TPA: TetR/AcrR family transcriptional regulator [Solirubrobacteraceae bacterium]|jgi:AcrR family transcriptional regulator|nr:TetR/AcrR family transcriptional regulator [Solirubrobacteraceae bacterium]
MAAGATRVSRVGVSDDRLRGAPRGGGASRADNASREGSAKARREANGLAGGLGVAQISQIQRARILAAMFDVVTERGSAGLSVAHVVERSGVSRRTFYEIFSDREDCFMAAFDDALAFAAQRVLPAYQAEKRWRERIRGALVALLAFLEEEPIVARLLIVESLAWGGRALERRNEIVSRLVLAVDEGRREARGGAALPELTGEGIVGGVLSILQTKIAGGDGESLVELTNQLMGMIVIPYLGAAAARRELDRVVEPRTPDRRDARLLADPFKHVGMRLTYRTVRVLLAVSEHPNASNRVIGEAAGIKDQGQISKLLGRLQRLALIDNVGLGPGQGAPNAWTLTDAGREMTRSIRTHADTPK